MLSKPNKIYSLLQPNGRISPGVHDLISSPSEICASSFHRIRLKKKPQNRHISAAVLRNMINRFQCLSPLLSKGAIVSQRGLSSPDDIDLPVFKHQFLACLNLPASQGHANAHSGTLTLRLHMHIAKGSELKLIIPPHAESTHSAMSTSTEWYCGLAAS